MKTTWNAGSRRKFAAGHLSNSTSREELVSLGVCVACRGRHAVNSEFCHECLTRFSNIDRKVFAGYFAEIKRGYSVS